MDSANQVIIIAADIIGSGSEQSMLLPMIEQAAAYRDAHMRIPDHRDRDFRRNVTDDSV